MPRARLWRLTSIEKGRKVELFYESVDELLAMVGHCLTGRDPHDDPARIEILSCTCGELCCVIHMTHTTPHMGCVMR